MTVIIEKLPRRARSAKYFVLLGTVGVAAALTAAIASMPADPAVDLGSEVTARIDQSGVSNPVTAVLLNFRSYDTLLEIAVLFLTVVAVWALQLEPASIGRWADSPMFRSLLRVAVPGCVLLAGYLLWIGAYAPGGAFQAGAVLAGAGVLMLLAGTRVQGSGVLRAGIALGLGVFLGVALAAVAAARNYLEYPPWLASELILLIETTATLSIGLTLAALFAAAEPKSFRPGDE